MESSIDKTELVEARTATKKFFSKLESEMVHASSVSSNVFSFDWVDEMLEACPRLDIIIRNAKVALVQEANVELIEKAKRITVESVKDLARHTNYINTFDEKTGMVEPGKILDIRNEETYNIYENRFLYTLVYTMERFLLQKEDEIKNMEVLHSKSLEYSGSTKTNEEKINIEVKISSESFPNDDVDEKSKDKIKEIKQKIKTIKEYIGSWQKSEMIKALDKAHVVHVKSPLKKTNILLKNPNFRVATKLWEFLQKYDEENTKSDSAVSDGNDVIKGFLDHSFLIDFYVMDSVYVSKREQKKHLAKYALVMLSEEIRRIVDLFNACGIKITEEEVLKMLASELNENKGERLAGVDDIKKKFKSAMDEYLERAQEYL